MGGTRFNGLALVQELVKWGHEVTVLNRGQSEARLPRAVRRLYADRTNHEQLREVLGHEEFDVVADLSGYALADVQPLVEVFRGRIGHYLFGSSTVIYAKPRVLPVRETDPVDRSERQTEYGLQKLKVEAYLFDQYRANGFPATVVPLSMVLGPHNMVADREQRMFQRLLREDVGFRPAYTFEAAVEHTYDWFRREKLDESLRFDFSWEDNLIERMSAQ